MTIIVLFCFYLFFLKKSSYFCIYLVNNDYFREKMINLGNEWINRLFEFWVATFQLYVNFSFFQVFKLFLDVVFGLLEEMLKIAWRGACLRRSATRVGSLGRLVGRVLRLSWELSQIFSWQLCCVHCWFYLISQRIGFDCVVGELWSCL